ncbi:tRNA-splicing endonuclease subunit Sen15-like [Montipora foliosa]|uniref:tRNA-splicing endonuclease subunit Sen15-like n=1 Tax=Montipora foliosa TaxID=591990 RepID=UPI0035F1C294
MLPKRHSQKLGFLPGNCNIQERLSRIVVMASQEIHQHKVRRENWLEDHPKFKEIQSYGYYDDKSSMARAAITVYLDLCESKHWFGVCIRPCESMKIVYITGKRTKKSQMEAVVPLTIDTAMTTEEIQNVLQEVTRCEEESKDVKCEKIETSKVVIGFCEADSTVVYYDFYQGLVPPDPPDEETKEG